MTDMKPENQGFYRATIFLRALRQNGVKHVVISPGSRSTPLTMAAACLPNLQKHVILDERSAAFMALGIGKSTGVPAALICTSGTAVANYFPAVIEAQMSGVPILLLTADRPPHLHHSGANQTIDQQHIFGDYPVFFHDVGEPILDENTRQQLQILGAQVIHHSCNRQGPIHLNFPFRKPLEPEQDFVKKIIRENENLPKKNEVKFLNNRVQSFRLDDDILYEIHTTERPLIIVGQLTPAANMDSIFALADSLNAPLLSEQGIINPAYAIRGFEGFLRRDENRMAMEPDLILRFGRQPASKSLLQAIKKWNPRRHIYFSDSGNWSNIGETTTDFINWNGTNFYDNKFPTKSPGWLDQWKQVEAAYFEASTTILEDTDPLTDNHIYHFLAPKIPRQWSVSFSNSLPARDHSMFGRWNRQRLFTNRGASGIDGITSTAMGVNLGRHQPGILFTGDLAFLHDTNALLNHKELQQPLVIVVINNQGGSIFRMLPIARHKSYFRPYFETPQQADIAQLVQSYGLHATKVKTTEELKKINLKTIIEQSDYKLHVIECQTNAAASMQVRNKLWRYKNEG